MTNRELLEKVESTLNDLNILYDEFYTQRPPPVACLQIEAAQKQLRYVRNDLVCAKEEHNDRRYDAATNPRGPGESGEN